MDFFDRVKTGARDNSTTIKYVVEKAGLKLGSYNTLRRENRLPRANEVLVIAKELGTTVEYLLTGEVITDKKESGLERGSSSLTSPLKVLKVSEIGPRQFRVPLLNQKVSAGHGTDLVEDEEERAFIPAPEWLSRYGRDVAALMVTGDSMEPTLRNGDLVVCDTHGWEYEGVYVIQLGDQEFVKRIQKLPKTFRIISDNPRYPIMEEPAESQDLRIVGLVRCVVRMLE